MYEKADVYQDMDYRYAYSNDNCHVSSGFSGIKEIRLFFPSH